VQRGLEKTREGEGSQKTEQQRWETKSSFLRPNLTLSSSFTHFCCYTTNSHFQCWFLWVLATCHQKNLETTLSTYLDCLAGQEDNFSINFKKQHRNIYGTSEYSDPWEIWLEYFQAWISKKKCAKSTNYKQLSKMPAAVLIQEANVMLSSLVQGTGPYVRTSILTICALPQDSLCKWVFAFVLLWICFLIHWSLVLF
jgi:hypothetical protein